MEDNEYIFIKHKIRQLTDVDLNNYKSPQVQRRLRTYLARSGYPNWAAYFKHSQDDPNEIRKLRDYLTINVTTFYRDPNKFEYLQASVLPMLLKERTKLRIWSAGCSRGQEPYSLAIMLAEMTSIYRQHTILATDLDYSALEWAQAGGPYFANELVNLSEEVQASYFKPDGKAYYISERLRRNVTFGTQDLLHDGFEGDFDLIVCRNVVIYFTGEAKVGLYKRFYEALRPGGILFLGGTEMISSAAQLGFETLKHSFYRKSP